MLSINTNLSSLITQRSAKQSTDILNQSIERMTTGYKINHAKDNAANYSIATNMSTQISAYMVAEDNALQGLDMLNTASESLTLIEDKLMRLRALAEQSANGTYGEQSKQAINSEANAIVDEINRIYTTAEYNGIKLFDQEVQMPDDPNIPKAQYDGFIKEVIRRDTSAMTTLASVDSNTALADGTYSISTPEEMKKLADMTNAGLVSGGDEFVLANDIDLSQYENWIPIGNAVVKDGGWHGNSFKGKFDGNGFVIADLRINDAEARYVGLFGYIQDSSVKNLGLVNVDITASAYVAGLVSSIQTSLIENCYLQGADIVGLNGCASGLVNDCTHNSTIDSCYATSTSIVAYDVAAGLVGYLHKTTVKDSFVNIKECIALNGTRVGGLISHSNIGTIENCSVLGSTFGLQGIISGGFTSTTRSLTIKNCSYSSFYETQNIPLVTNNIGNLTLENINTVEEKALTKSMQIGINSEKESSIDIKFEANLGFNFLRLIGCDNSFNITKFSLFDYLDLILKKLSEKQTEFGAVQNRLESALDEISIKYENLVSSRSTIRDADIADESSNYIQAQILQQAAATLMATANQSPAIALQLI